jgi:hypothetical protein
MTLEALVHAQKGSKARTTDWAGTSRDLGDEDRDRTLDATHISAITR